MEELGLQKELKGDRNRTDDLSWPKGHSILYDVMQSNKTGGAGWGGVRGGWLPPLGDWLGIA